MKDGGNDEKRQDNSKVENMERVSIDGWWLTDSSTDLSESLSPYSSKLVQAFYEFMHHEKNMGLCVDIVIIQLQVNAPTVDSKFTTEHLKFHITLA